MNRSMTPLHSDSPTYDGVIVIPNHFTSLSHASVMYCRPQSHRIRRPRATSFAKRPNTWRTPWRSDSSSVRALDDSGGVAGFLRFVPMSGLLGHGHPSQLRVPRNRVRFSSVSAVVLDTGG